MCARCDSHVSFIQPPTPICTCHLLLCPLTSEAAGCPPTFPVECDQLERQPGLRMKPLCRVCDRQQTQRALHTACLIIRPHGGGGQGNSMWCAISAQCTASHPALLLILSWPHAWPKTIIPSPLVLQFLPHMCSGQSSSACVDALTDRKRNSSSNRPIVWLTGEH